MKTLIVCHSKFGNTRAIANAIAEALKSAGNVELISFDQLEREISELVEGVHGYRRR